MRVLYGVCNRQLLAYNNNVHREVKPEGNLR